MSKLIDLTGKRFGALLVLERDLAKNNGKTTYWKCQCDCGNIVSKASAGLKKGETVCCDRYKCPNKKFLGKDLTGQKFGRLTVIKPLKERKWDSIVWECQCECGNIINVPSTSLLNNKTRSCGCLKKETDRQPKGNVIDLTNQTFGHLTVIKRDGSDARGEAKWLCQCDCGNTQLISVLGSNLRNGHTQSCGCERRSHGELKVAQILQENNISFIQEYQAFKFSNGTWAKFDFYVNNQYFIEYDGETHYKYNLHGWHTEERLEQQLERDAIKNQWCKENNIPLIRIPYTQLKELSINDLKLETSTFIYGGD